MNFITDLLTSKNIEEMKFNVILVIVNWLSKMAYFILTQKNLSTEDLTHLVVHEIVRIHELSVNIVTD